MLIQQGDVLIHRVSEIPNDAKRVKGKIVLAEGEVTGHAHVIEKLDGCEAFEDEQGVLWLTVEKESTVKHEEHGPVTIPPGKYKIGIVREVDPFEDEVRNVRD